MEIRFSYLYLSLYFYEYLIHFRHTIRIYTVACVDLLSAPSWLFWNSFLKQETATISPSAIRSKATINCNPSIINTNPPVTKIFVKIPITACTRAVNVTTNMMHIGAYNIHPFLPVVNKKTDNAINTKDANNWFAAPNNGQMLLYPPKHNKNPKNNVITVEKYLFVTNFLTPVRSEPSAASPMNNSWNDIRPILATESRDVNASAEKHIVIKQVATCLGIPSSVKNPATFPEKIWNGVPSGILPPTAAAPTTTKAITPNKDSTIIDPYPTQSMSFSLLTVLDDVPEDTKLWNPETAPQAIVINNVGNKLFPPTLNPLNAGKFIAG